MTEPRRIVLADSITHPLPLGAVVVCGSHGGKSAAIFALRQRVSGVVFNDAGVGKDGAGIAGLELLADYGVPAAAVDALTARIGLAADTALGTVSHANGLALAAGVRIGQRGQEAAEIMGRFEGPGGIEEPPEELEERVMVIRTFPDGRRIITLDSNALVTAEMAGDVVLTGSHGGLVGDLPAVKHPVLAAFYNDAGMGKDKAGISRLPWLQKSGIIGLTVSASSARIGEGRSTYEDGIVSHLNDLARSAGLFVGQPAKDAARRILEVTSKNDLPD